MTEVLVISILFNLVWATSTAYFARESRNQAKRADSNALGWSAEAESHRETKEQLRNLQESIKPIVPEQKTALDIVKEAPKRLKLRKSWSDEERKLEEKHNTKAKKHLDLVQELENIHHIGPKRPKE